MPARIERGTEVRPDAGPVGRSVGLCFAVVMLALPVKGPALAVELVGGAFSRVDDHVVAIKRPNTGNSAEFAQRLVKTARNDLERARAIAWWMASHIEYDHEMFRQEFPRQQAGQTPRRAIAANEPAAVMARGKAVCSGYAALFVALCKSIGLEAVEISGKVRYNDVGHTWNAVQIDGRWQLLDITSMAAGAGNARKGIGKPVEFYFLPAPELFVFSHFPHDPRWQLLPSPVTWQEFRAVPEVMPPLLSMVARPAMLRQAAREGVREFVPAALPETVDVNLLDAPLGRELPAGRACRFQVRASDCAAVHVDNGGKKSLLDRRGDVFQGTVTPEGAFLRIGVEPRSRRGTVEGMLEYRVGGQHQPPPDATLADAIRRLLNDARRRDGARPLRADDGLDQTAVAHAREMARQQRTSDRASCLVAAVDSPSEPSAVAFAGRFVSSLMENPVRRAGACAPAHSRVGVGTAVGNGRTYFCVEFQ